MFGGPPPPASKEEVLAKEQESTETLVYFGTGAVLLYLSPHAISYIRNFF